jgi:hypothetical protein
MERDIIVRDPKDRFEADRKWGLQRFRTKFPSVRTPNCAICSAATNSQYVKVGYFAMDFDPALNHMVFTAKCHGDTLELRQDLNDVLQKTDLDFRMVFKEGQGRRVEGKRIDIIPRKHALDTTHAY